MMSLSEILIFAIQNAIFLTQMPGKDIHSKNLKNSK